VAIVGGVLTGLGTVIGPWIVFRAFHELRRVDALQGFRRPMAWALLLDYVAIVCVGLTSSLATIRFEDAVTVLCALSWQRARDVRSRRSHRRGVYHCLQPRQTSRVAERARPGRHGRACIGSL